MRGITRRGTVLILVAGISALVVTTAVAFLTLVQRGSSVSARVLGEAQCRTMLHAACLYVLEGSRLGYDTPAFVKKTGQHREGHGWIDVRDMNANNGVGPLDQFKEPVFAPGSRRWPDIGGVVVCPMYRWTRPPCAISPRMAYNPIIADDERRGDPRWGRPYLTQPDPLPVVDNGWPAEVHARNWNAFLNGDSTPSSATMGRAWFRIRRHSASRFIVTCGAGGTNGFRDWEEVLAAGSNKGPAGTLGGPEFFDGNPRLFDSLLAAEVRTWYEIQWSAAVVPLYFHYFVTWDSPDNKGHLPYSYIAQSVNSSQSNRETNRYTPNPVGTISYIQRLDGPPSGKHPDTGLSWDW